VSDLFNARHLYISSSVLAVMNGGY
jgi:hypothetical protein